MPEIKIQHIVSYSSQDTKNPADNLLKPDGVHKWRSASAGEKSLSVILQLEKASRIHSIDIGNEGSAFIEVLVGRSTSSSSEDFQVILVTSSFMSPMESRNNTNRCSVRMFGPEKLTKTVFEEKWDRVKIICTQPFNKMTNYGLSFVKFHSPPSSGNDSNSAKPEEDDDLTNPKKIGAFFFRRDEDEKFDLKAGSLFAQQKAKAESSPLTGAAAIRAASNEARSSYLEMKSSPGSGASETKKKRKHSESDEDTSEVKKTKSKNGIGHQSSKSSSSSSSNNNNNSSSLQKTRQKEESRKEKHSHHEKKEKKHSSKGEGKPTLHSSSSSNSTSSSSSHKNNHHKLDVITNKANNTSKPFRKIMDTVVFVLSGFQNPCRADIRDKAREMGATYRPDWSTDCTHLVCAFVNTPKYKAVKGRGRIVTKNWVLDCYRQKTLLPWRKFQLEELDDDDDDDDDDGDDDGDGDGDDDRKKERAVKKKKKQEKDDDEEEKEEDEKEKEEEESWSCLPKKKSDPDYLPSGEDQNSEEEEEEKADEVDEDTDDELMRLKNSLNKTESESDETHRARQSTSADTQEINSQKNNDNSDDDDDDDDAFGAATDVDEDSDDSDLNCELPVLPDFFSDKHFFLYGDFSESQRHDLTRYIVTYNGELEDYMSEKVDFVVTYEQWDDNFDEALSNYPQLNFVKPDWLYSCHKKNKWVPYQLHIVTPSLT